MKKDLIVSSIKLFLGEFSFFNNPERFVRRSKKYVNRRYDKCEKALDDMEKAVIKSNPGLSEITHEVVQKLRRENKALKERALAELSIIKTGEE